VEGLGAATADQRVVAALAVDLGGGRGRERPVGLVDTDEIVAISGVDDDPVEPMATDPEVSRAVVVDIDFECAGVAGPQPQGKLVIPRGAGDRQRALRDADARAGNAGRLGAGREAAGQQPGDEYR